MSYENEELLKDNKGIPIPQYYDTESKRFKPITKDNYSDKIQDVKIVESKHNTVVRGNVDINNLPSDYPDSVLHDKVDNLNDSINNKDFPSDYPDNQVKNVLEEMRSKQEQLYNMQENILNRLDGRFDTRLTGSIVDYDHPISRNTEVAPGEEVIIYENRDFTLGETDEWWMSFMAQFDAGVAIYWSYRNTSLTSTGGRIFRKRFTAGDGDLGIGEGSDLNSGDTFVLKKQPVYGNYLRISIFNNSEATDIVRNVMFFEGKPLGVSR